MNSSHAPVPFEGLASADLVVGRIYRGGPQPNVGADPLHRLTGVGNSGGFRKKTIKGTAQTALCVLFSTGVVSEWPDGWTSDGQYVYFGDQRTPGRDVLDTPRGGNRLLAEVQGQMAREERSSVPPFLLFEKAGHARDVRFEGLLVPAPRPDWLTVESRVTPAGTFANYRAVLDRLPDRAVTRLWLHDVLQGTPYASSAPEGWARWVDTGATR